MKKRIMRAILFPTYDIIVSPPILIAKPPIHTAVYLKWTRGLEAVALTTANVRPVFGPYATLTVDASNVRLQLTAMKDYDA